MSTGTIISWHRDRGFGFVQRDDGQANIFAHIRNVADDVDELRPGQRVQFEPGIDLRNGKPEARDVRVIEG
jgi:CspA family cold shock protein